MPARLGLALAGRTFSFAFDSAPFARAMSRRYSAFLSAARGPALTVAAGGPPEPPFSPRVEGWPRVRGRRGDFDFSFDARSASGRAVVSPRAQSFDSFLRALLSALLNPAGGALVHACGIAVKRRAYVFIGRSGAGKSTLARLASRPGAEVISDEIVPLRLERGKFYAYGSPFWGEMRSAGRTMRLPLAGVYILKKSRLLSVRPAAAEEFVPLFLRCCLNFSGDPAAAAGLLATASALSRLPARELFFPKRGASFIGLLK